MFAALKLFYHNTAGLLFKGAILSDRGLPRRSLYSYMANVKSVVLIIELEHTMRTRLRRDKQSCTYLRRIECDTRAAAVPAPGSTRPRLCPEGYTT